MTTKYADQFDRSRRNPPTPATINAAIGATPVPLARAYLYSTKNALFTDSISISAGADGMLTNSDTVSNQQVTAILTELAQAAGVFVTPAKKIDDSQVSPEISEVAARKP